MWRVIKPGGIASITTELILNRVEHDQYFNLSQLQDVVLFSTPMRLVGGDLDLRISTCLFENPIDLERDDLSASPHLVLKAGDVIFTSVTCFLQKPM